MPDLEFMEAFLLPNPHTMCGSQVRLLACCTMGKNVYTEIKCHSLLPLDDIVKMVLKSKNIFHRQHLCHHHQHQNCNSSLSSQNYQHHNSVSITTVKYITSMFISRQVVHKDTIPEVKDAYVNFLTHCYIDTEVDLDYLNSKDNPGVFTGGDERDLHIKSHVGSL